MSPETATVDVPSSLPTGLLAPTSGLPARWGRPRIAGWVVDLARRLDSRYELLGVRFGIDAMLGLVPVVGDLLSALLGSAVIVEAIRLRASIPLVARMLGHLAIDALIGVIPILGDAADILYKPNERNLRLLRRELARRGARAYDGAAIRRTGESP